MLVAQFKQDKASFSDQVQRAKYLIPLSFINQTIFEDQLKANNLMELLGRICKGLLFCSDVGKSWTKPIIEI